jgi:hypothetical protein
MSGDVHVRFCESRGLQRPRPLTYGSKPAKKKSKKTKKK